MRESAIMSACSAMNSAGRPVTRGAGRRRIPCSRRLSTGTGRRFPSWKRSMGLKTPTGRICITILQRRTCSEENSKRLPAVSKQPSRSWKKYSARIIPARRRSWRIMPLPGSGMTGANDEGHEKAIRRGYPAGWLYSSSRNTRDFSRGIRAQKGKLASSRRTHERAWNI